MPVALCPDCGQRGFYAGRIEHGDGMLVDVYVCCGLGGCTVDEYQRGHR